MYLSVVLEDEVNHETGNERFELIEIQLSFEGNFWGSSETPFECKTAQP